ncbi:hypothetical protein SFRURICE_019647, partial [Spodoptera frugiperda]
VFFLWVRLQTYNFSLTHTHATQTRNNILWVTQGVAPCGNRTHYTLHSSQLPSHCTDRAVKPKKTLPHAMIFSCIVTLSYVYKHTSSHTHGTQIVTTICGSYKELFRAGIVPASCCEAAVCPVIAPAVN